MRAAAAGKKAETIHRRQVAGDRIGDSRLEPADRPRTRATQEDATLVRLAQDDVEAPVAPDGEHAPRVAAADVDDVELEEGSAQIGGRAPEEGEGGGGRGGARGCPA